MGSRQACAPVVPLCFLLPFANGILLDQASSSVHAAWAGSLVYRADSEFNADFDEVPPPHKCTRHCVTEEDLAYKLPLPSREEKDRVATAEERCALGNDASPGPAAGTPLEPGVITFLATRDSDAFRLEHIVLPLLRKNLLIRRPYPIIVFMPSSSALIAKLDFAMSLGVRTKLQESLLRVVGQTYDLKVVEFSHNVTDAIHLNSLWVSPTGWHTGYLYMNQFFTRDMFEQHALDAYRFFMRLDTDVRIMEMAKEDPFCMIRETGKRFLFHYAARVFECCNWNEGMAEWFANYSKAEKLKPQDPSLWASMGTDDPKSKVVYKGYASLGDLNFFKSEQVRKLANAFNEDGRVYTKRWSDYSYLVQALALFEKHDAVGDLGFRMELCHHC